MFAPYFASGHDPMAHADIANVRSLARGTRSALEELRLENERLLMISEALWSFIKQHFGYTDGELVTRIQEIDLQDGRLDGRVARKAPAKCTGCGRALARGRPVCIFCGRPASRNPFRR